MTLAKCAVFVLVTTIFGGVAGLGIGVAIGTYAPGVYVVQFPAARNDDGSPRADFPFVEVGAGIGLMQGVVLGLVAGLVLVGFVTWYKIRTSSASGR